MNQPASDAAAIFSQGPETLIADCSNIVAGRPARLGKEVTEASGGPGPIPVAWTISGELVDSVWLKGAADPREAGVRHSFRRPEKALFAVMDSSTPDWELELGSVEQAAMVVLFYRTARAQPRVLPSPKVGPDLVQLVTDLVRIQSIAEDSARIQALLDYASAAPSSEGRKAALRSLVACHAAWTALQPAWSKLLHDPSSPQEVRTFASLLLVHWVLRDRWPRDQASAVSLVVDAFAREPLPALAFSYTDGLQLLHDAALREPKLFPGVAQAIVAAVRKKATLGSAADEHARSLNEAYLEMRERLLTPVRSGPVGK